MMIEKERKMTCKSCSTYFGNGRHCNADRFGECDCPKCQGLCDCEDEHKSENEKNRAAVALAEGHLPCCACGADTGIELDGSGEQEELCGFCQAEADAAKREFERDCAENR